MSGDIEIRRAYREDLKDPYYSIQGGKKRRASNRSRGGGRSFTLVRSWRWGHFETALRNAMRAA